jgi:hypothetical protein
MSSLRLAHAQAEEIAAILARALRRRESAPPDTRNSHLRRSGCTESPTNHVERPGQRNSGEGREHGPGS